MRSHTIAISSLLLVAFSACTSSSSDQASTIEVAAASSTIGTEPATATFDSSSQTLTMVTDGGATVNFGMPGFTSRDFLIYNINDGFARLAETEDGGGFVILAAGDVADGIATQEIRRIGVTNLPTEGSVEYAGSYIALVVMTDGTDPFNSTVGDADLTVDFAASEVSGSITGRTTGMEPLDDVTFQIAALGADGAFSGATDQVSATISSNTSTGTGTYTGMITDADASSAVGTLTIDYAGGTWNGATELGIFVVEASQP